jgi:hypothetical protein
MAGRLWMDAWAATRRRWRGAAVAALDGLGRPFPFQPLELGAGRTRSYLKRNFMVSLAVGVPTSSTRITPMPLKSSSGVKALKKKWGPYRPQEEDDDSSPPPEGKNLDKLVEGLAKLHHETKGQ